MTAGMNRELDESRIILITGIMAAGKSSVAQRLAERLPRSVHLRGDVFRRMIVNGRAEMGRELSADAYAQLQLRYQLAIHAARQYRRAGFDVVYQDIVVGAVLHEVVRQFEGEALYVVVLCPSVEAVAAREAGRPKIGYSDDFTPSQFDRVFREETPRLGFWLDSSALSVDETVDAILTNLSRAKVAAGEDSTL
jgi:chloramphenicol 3-O-phosphotransferase